LKTYFHAAFILLFLISLAGCGKKATVEDILKEEVTGEISISRFISGSRLLNNAAARFQQKYPGVVVKVEDFEPLPVMGGGTNDYSQMQTDYLTRLNIELMSGGGADILQIDVIPWYKYADRGYLEDLRQYMDLDAGFNKSGLRMNYLDAVAFKGGIYTFPLYAQFSFFAYDASLFNSEERNLLSAKGAFTVSELIDIAENAFERNNKAYNMFGLTGTPYKNYSIWENLLSENYVNFVDIPNKQAHFDDGRFENLLLSLKEYCEKGYIKEISEINDAYISGKLYYDITVNPNPNPDERFFYKYEESYYLFQNFDMGLAPSVSVYGPTIGNDDNDAVVGITADCNGNIPFQSYDMLAINANSKNKRAAWEFIKFLTSDEVQSTKDVTRISINKNIFEESEMSRLFHSGLKRAEISEEHMSAYNDYIACLDKFANMINTYTIRDDRIDQLIQDEVTRFFNGEKSAKDAAAALQNKVNLYLNE